MKKFTPTYYAQTLYDIPPSFFLKVGTTTLVIDLDNTLAAYDEVEATVKTITYVRALEAAGLRVLLVSNNREPRVKTYALSLDVPYLAKAYKPLKRRLVKYLKQYNVDKSDVMMVGDQLLTDVFCANNLGVKIILTEKLVERDQITTRFNRLLDRPLRKRLHKKGKLKEWHEHG